MKKKEKNRYHEITLDEQPFKVEAGLSLQEISEKIEADLIFGCFSGRCGICKIEVIEKIENLSTRTDLEEYYFSMTGEPNQYRLACQCHVLGNVSIKTTS